MRMLIVGAGSTGGLIGARLMAFGRDVTFLVRPKRASALREHGLQVVSPLGDLVLTPKLLTSDALSEPFDVVLVTVKAYSLKRAIDDFAPAVGDQTMVAAVLNGMRHIDDLKCRFGDGHVVGAVCRVATELDGAGRVVQLNQLQDLVYGELDGRMSPRIKLLDEFLRDTGFATTLTRTVMQELWNKWIQLAITGAVCSVARGNVGEIAATQGGEEFVRAMAAECIAVATACGHGPSEQFIDQTLKSLTALGSNVTSSMYRDLVAGRPVEVEQILGDMRTRAQVFNISSSLLSAAYIQLAIYERKRIARETTSEF
jgi:2-dehydropantoate 2-reductase